MKSEAGTATANAKNMAPKAPCATVCHGTAKLAGSPQCDIVALVAAVKSQPVSAPSGNPAAIPDNAVRNASSARIPDNCSFVAPTASRALNSYFRESADDSIVLKHMIFQIQTVSIP